MQYYKVDYESRWFYPIVEDYVLALQGQVGYGDGYGESSELPFFENFYAGGPRSVRGYEENTLGPDDSAGRALGEFLLVANADVILPVPFLQDLESVRVTALVDAGNVRPRRECRPRGPQTLGGDFGPLGIALRGAHRKRGPALQRPG